MFAGPRVLGDRHLGFVGEPRRGRAAAAVHRGVLRRAAQGMDAVAPAGRDRAVHRRGDRLDDRCRARRLATPARTEDQASIWWLLAFAGALTVVTGKAIPYYRFMNASAAPMALVGLGTYAAIRWFFTDRAPAKLDRAGPASGWRSWAIAGWRRADRVLRSRAGLDLRRDAAARRAGRAARASPATSCRGCSSAALGGGARRRLDELDHVRRPAAAVGLRHQPVGQPERAHLARRRPRGSAGRGRAPERARSVELPRQRRSRDRHEHRVRLGEDLDERLPHRPARRRRRALGDVPRHHRQLPRRASRRPRAPAARATTTSRASISARPSGLPTRSVSAATRRSRRTSCRGSRSSPRTPVVFLIGQYYEQGSATAFRTAPRNSGSRCSTTPSGRASTIGPDVAVLTGDGLWTPPADVVRAAQDAAAAKRSRAAEPSGRVRQPAAQAAWCSRSSRSS